MHGNGLGLRSKTRLLSAMLTNPLLMYRSDSFTRLATQRRNQTMNALNKTAKFVGVLYVVITVLAPFSMSYVPSTLIAPGDAVTTSNNILASEGLFRAGIASDAVVFLAEIALTVALYALLKPVSKTLSLTAAFARLGMTIIQG